jgi:hypothetical protein
VMSGVIRDDTQDARTLRELESGEWVEAPRLSKISLQYCRVIASLRKKQFVIENRVETVNGVRHGFYRLIQPRDARSQSKADTKAHVPQTLFGDITPDRSYME